MRHGLAVMSRAWWTGWVASRGAASPDCISASPQRPGEPDTWVWS